VVTLLDKERSYEDRFETEPKVNVIEDMIYEKYENKTPPIPDARLRSQGEGTDRDQGPKEPERAAADQDQTGRPDWRQTRQNQELWEDQGKKARFSDRVKINHAMRLIMESFLKGNVREQEFLTFFKISLDEYTDFLNSRTKDAVHLIAGRIIQTLNDAQIELSRLETAEDALRREQLLVSQPENLWQRKNALLVQVLKASIQTEEAALQDAGPVGAPDALPPSYV
jgi:hypothetical protein